MKYFRKPIAKHAASKARDTIDFLRKRKWKTVVAGLSLAVVFATISALTLPATTMSNDVYCGSDEHSHTEECYEQKLICGMEETAESSGHVHTEDCYQTEAQITCGLEESEESAHEHTEACYDEAGEQVCGYEENEGEAHTHDESCNVEIETLICGEEEIAESHTHSESCYERVLVCNSEEHTHTLACYSNPEADVETAEDWEKTLDKTELSGTWAKDLIAVAKTQLNYKESEDNFTVDEDGTTRHGYTRYGEWAGTPYAEWNTLFVEFCLSCAEVDEEKLPYAEDIEEWVKLLSGEAEEYKELDLYREAGEYTPAAGDLVFIDEDDDGAADRVGIVSEYSATNANASTAPSQEGSSIKTSYAIKSIEGDVDGQVKEVIYKADDESILGFAQLPENEAAKETESGESEAAPEASTVEGTEESAPGESAAEEPEDLTTLTAEYEGYVVTVSYGADAGIPEGAELIVKPSENESSPDEIAELTGDSEAQSVVRLNIGLYVDGEEIEPAQDSSVSVKITVPGGQTLNGKMAVVHYRDDGTAEVLDDVDSAASGEDDSVLSFTTNGFSDYEIMVTSGDDGVSAVSSGSDGDSYSVSVNDKSTSAKTRDNSDEGYHYYAQASSGSTSKDVFAVSKGSKATSTISTYTLDAAVTNDELLAYLQAKTNDTGNSEITSNNTMLKILKSILYHGWYGASDTIKNYAENDYSGFFSSANELRYWATQRAIWYYSNNWTTASTSYSDCVDTLAANIVSEARSSGWDTGSTDYNLDLYVDSTGTYRVMMALDEVTSEATATPAPSATPTTAPTPSPTPAAGSETDVDPAIEKYVKDNSDGTYDLTLTVTGDTATSGNKALLDIIFVIDTSGSMESEGNSDEEDRLTTVTNAITTMVNNLSNNDKVDARYQVVTFADSAAVKTSTWVEGSIVGNYMPASADGGTNYQDALVKTAAAASTAKLTGRENAETIVLFLSDGVPQGANFVSSNSGDYDVYNRYGSNYYYAKLSNSGLTAYVMKGTSTEVVIYNNTSASKSYSWNAYTNLSGNTQRESMDVYYAGALMGAEALTVDYFYAVGFGSSVNSTSISSQLPLSYSISTPLQLLQNVAGAVNSKNNTSSNRAAVVSSSGLSSYIKSLEGTFTSITMSNVTVTDNINTTYAQLTDDAKLTIKVEDDSGAVLYSATDTAANGVSCTVNDGATITAGYNSTTGKLTLDFPDSYTLKQGWKYYVTTQIEPTAAAKTYYSTNKSYPNTGDANTDDPSVAEADRTSSNKPGFYSNTSATLTYTSNGADKEARYPKPVIQVIDNPVTPSPTPNDLDVQPEKQKYIKDNGDGTYDLTLNVKGDMGSESNPKEIDIVLVVDTSSSMEDNMAGGTATNSAPSRLTRIQQNVSTLVTYMNNKTGISAHYRLVTFNTTATAYTSYCSSGTWMDGATLTTKVNSLTTSGATNYQDALVKASAALSGAHDNAETVVLFLTDGVPTILQAQRSSNAANYFSFGSYRYVLSNEGTHLFQIFQIDDDETYQYDYANALYYKNGDSTKYVNSYGGYSGWDPYRLVYEASKLGAATITDCDYFYAVGFSSSMASTLDYVTSNDGVNKLPQNLLTNVTNATGASRKSTTIAVTADSLSSFFADFEAKITKIEVGNVTITDYLSQYVESYDGATLTLTVKDASGTTVKTGSTTLGANGGSVTVSDFDSSATGETLTATYDPVSKKLTADFNDNYALADSWTYEVTIKIKPNSTAVQYYLEKGYPHKGDANTDAPGNSTSSGKEGFYSNAAATLTYTITGNSSPSVENYDDPVVQVDPRTEISIQKTSSTNTDLFLSGARFVLYYTESGEAGVNKYYTGTDSSTGEASFTTLGTGKTEADYAFTTAEDSTLVFGGLPDNVYYLKEIEAPDGYTVRVTTITFVIENGKVVSFDPPHSESVQESIDSPVFTDDGYTYFFKVENNPGVELPQTGGAGTTLFTLGGIGIMTGAAILVYRYERRRKREVSKVR